MPYGAQVKYIHQDSVRRLQEQVGGTRQDALKALRQLLHVSSYFTYGVRSASFTKRDVEQVHLRAQDKVSIPGKYSSP